MAPYENALTVDGYEISGDGEEFDKIHARLSALRPGGKLIVKVLRWRKVISHLAGYTAQFFSNSWASRSYLATIP